MMSMSRNASNQQQGVKLYQQTLKGIPAVLAKAASRFGKDDVKLNTKLLQVTMTKAQN